MVDKEIWTGLMTLMAPISRLGQTLSGHCVLVSATLAMVGFLLSTHADRQSVDYRLLFVFCLFVCTVTDFSAEDKASGVKFCTEVHRRPGQGISHFGELCFPRSRKLDESATHPEVKFRMGRAAVIVTL